MPYCVWNSSVSTLVTASPGGPMRVTLPSRLPAATTVSHSDEPLADAAPGVAAGALEPGAAGAHAEKTSQLANAMLASTVDRRPVLVMVPPLCRLQRNSG